MMWYVPQAWWCIQLSFLLAAACWWIGTGLQGIFLGSTLGSISVWYGAPWNLQKKKKNTVKQSGYKQLPGCGCFLIGCSALLPLVFLLMVNTSDLPPSMMTNLTPLGIILSACHLLAQILMQVCQCNWEAQLLICQSHSSFGFVKSCCAYDGTTHITPSH